MSNDDKKDDKKQQGLTTTKPQAMATQADNPLAQLFKQWSSDKYILLSPITHTERLPEGTTIAVTEVSVDLTQDEKGKYISKDVYPIAGSGALMLSKTVLAKISNGAGISWTSIRRLDDCRHPHLFHIEVKGTMTDFDGMTRQICDAKCTDLRDDAGAGIMGKDCEAIVSKNKWPEKQLREARTFNAEITTTKAKNRAISGGLAINRSYSKEELENKTFIIPKLILDTRNPTAMRIAQIAAAGGASMLFGDPKVIDLPFIEVDPIDVQESPGECAGAGEVEDDSTSASPAPNGNGNEQTGTKEVFSAVLAEYTRAEAAGMTNDAFRKLCETTTGKTSREHMTASDATALTRAVGAYVESSDPSNDGCPV